MTCRNQVALGRVSKDETSPFRSGIVEGDVFAVVPVGVTTLAGGIPRFAVEAAFCQYGAAGPARRNTNVRRGVEAAATVAANDGPARKNANGEIQRIGASVESRNAIDDVWSAESNATMMFWSTTPKADARQITVLCRRSGIVVSIRRKRHRSDAEQATDAVGQRECMLCMFCIGASIEVESTPEAFDVGWVIHERGASETSPTEPGPQQCERSHQRDILYCIDRIVSGVTVTSISGA